MSRRIALADQLYGGNVVSTVLAPLCPNMVIWLKILKLTWFKLCPSPKKMRHINFDLSMKSNHFSQEMVHEGPFSDTRSPTIGYSSQNVFKSSQLLTAYIKGVAVKHHWCNQCRHLLIVLNSVKKTLFVPI